MKPAHSMRLLLIAALSFTICAAPATAGVGDMIKKAKAATGKKEKPAAAATETGAITSRINPPFNTENLARFKASMQMEIAEREKTVKFLATVKPKDVYAQCYTEWATSEAGQAHIAKMTSGMEGKTAEEMQKHMEVVGKEMQKALEAKCGPDPNTYNESWRDQQAREALGRASDNFLKDDYAYHIWKEWVAEFCNYIEKLKKEPDAAQKIARIKDEGLRIPGTGTGIYYVYTASESTQLLEQCEALMPLIKDTI